MDYFDQRLDFLQKGIGLVSHSVTLGVMATMVGAVGLAVSGLASWGTASEMGGTASLVFVLGASVLYLAGKAVCLRGPTARDIIAVSFGADAVSICSLFVMSLMGPGPAVAVLAGAVSLALFLWFLSRLATYLGSQDLSGEVGVTAKNYIGGFAVIIVGALFSHVSWFWMLAFLGGLILLMKSLRGYLRCLSIAQRALAACQAGDPINQRFSRPDF